MVRARTLCVFLWISAVGLGVGLGGKLFDLLVLARAWGAAPPASFALLPYGRRWPTNPGDFFQPLSVVIAVGVIGALISGWGTPAAYRIWLWVPVLAFLVIWVLTPTVFWPMINEQYGVATGRLARSDAEVVQLVHRWIVWDWARVGLIAVGFAGSLRAISLPLPRRSEMEGGTRTYSGNDGKPV